MLSIQNTHPQWHRPLENVLAQMDKNYLSDLSENTQWLPDLQNLFTAFHLPLTQTRYILLGEFPYPRAESANGFAFWDAAVGSL